MKKGEMDEVPIAAKDGCGESDLKSESRWKRRRVSGRTLELLEEKVSFPNVSKSRQQQIKFWISGLRDPSDLPVPRALSKEDKIAPYFDSERPIYSQSSWIDLPNVEVGKQLDVLDLLGDKLLCFKQSVPIFRPTKFRRYVGNPDIVARRGLKGGREVRRIQPYNLGSVSVESTQNLKGKYIMIFCVFAPLMWWSNNGEVVHHTALASHELAGRDDIVLVVVPMMRKGFTHSRSAYRHFLSGFSCHAVPFHDTLRREYICSALGFDGMITSVILDPSQKVLYHGWPFMFFRVGGAEPDCFPFTMERKNICLRRDDVLEGLSLNELLGLEDTDVLCNMLKDARTTVSELKQKLVGLYVCSDCRSLRKIQEVREECRRKEYELEIVVVCCPNDRVPPRLHQELVMDALASLKMLDLWFFPFNNTVSQRLKRMRETDSCEEGLFIVDTKEEYVDIYGLTIIHDFGTGCYPFTRRTLVEKEFQRLRGLRLNSLLHPWEHVCRKSDDDSSSIEEIHVAQVLNNKAVLLYLHAEQQRSLAEKLAVFTWYEKYIKRKHSNVEVVAVSIDGSGGGDKDFMEKGWLVCGADPTKSAKLCADYFHPLFCPLETLVAFDEDGRITSMDASKRLEESHGPPFLGNLREEIREAFDEAGFRYMLHTDYC